MSNYLRESRHALADTVNRILSRTGGYMWTITTVDVCDKATVCKRWDSMLHALRLEFPLYSGVRVVESHPGGPGWHLHCVSASRLDVKQAWHLYRAHGFGWMSLSRIGDESACAAYLCKDLGKGMGKGSGRAWATFGGFKGRTVSSCRYNSIERQYYDAVTVGEMLAAGNVGAVHPGSYRDGFGRVRMRYQVALTKMHYGAAWLDWWRDVGGWSYF